MNVRRRLTDLGSVLVVALAASHLGGSTASAQDVGPSSATLAPSASWTATWYDRTFDCGDSNWIDKVRVRGFGQRLDYMVTPTRRGRWFYDDRSGWPQITACAGDHGLGQPQLESIRKQLVCHAVDHTGRITGPDWGAESWRTNKPVWGRLPADCNWDTAAESIQVKASNFSGYRLYAYRKEQARIGRSPGAYTASFRVVPGLAGTGVSLESLFYPGYYLRHSNGAVLLQQFDAAPFNRRFEDLLFRADATFLSAGLGQDRDGTPILQNSFRLASWNFPSHHVRHYRGVVELGTPTTRRGTPFGADSKFVKVR
ncbi:AbfB domain-containing protein [Kineococcus sp. NUM-3379]